MSCAIRVVSVSLAFLFGCSGEGQKAQPESSPTGFEISKEVRNRCEVEGKRLVTLDLNQDNKPDVWKMYSTKTEGGAKVEILSCKEQDLNYDGRKDIWIYYDDQGSRQMEEMDLDFDGKIDLVTLRRGGKVIRQELDTNYDGKPDLWKHFEEEVLVRVERDENYNGKVDYWEYYEGGELDRVGYDKDGDGRPDEFSRAPAHAASASPPAQSPAKARESSPEKTSEQKSGKK